MRAGTPLSWSFAENVDVIANGGCFRSSGTENIGRTSQRDESKRQVPTLVAMFPLMSQMLQPPARAQRSQSNHTLVCDASARVVVVLRQSRDRRHYDLAK